MGKHRLIPHLIVEGGLDAIDFYERAFRAAKVAVMMAKDGKPRYGRVRDPFGHVWSFHALHKKKGSDEHKAMHADG